MFCLQGMAHIQLALDVAGTPQADKEVVEWFLQDSTFLLGKHTQVAVVPLIPEGNRNQLNTVQ